MKSIYDNIDLMHVKEQEIVGQNRHQFIYGFNNDERTSFLESLEYAYPIINHNYSPMVIYMLGYSLPNINAKDENIDRVKLSLISREFLNLSIVYNISNRLESSNIIDFNTFLSSSNSYLFLIPNADITDINSFSKFGEKVKNAMDIYTKCYKELLEKNSISFSDLSIQMPFIDAVEFTSYVKNLLGNKAYFSLIFDHKEDIPNASTSAINSFISSRINKDISIKVVTEAGRWNNMYDLSGNIIENIHDFGEVELDDNKKVYTKRHNRSRKI